MYSFGGFLCKSLGFNIKVIGFWDMGWGILGGSLNFWIFWVGRSDFFFFGKGEEFFNVEYYGKDFGISFKKMIGMVF